MTTNAEALLLKLKEFDSQLPDLIERYCLEYQGKLEPMHPEVLIRHIEAGIMVTISRAALLEIIKTIEDTQSKTKKLRAFIEEELEVSSHLHYEFEEEDDEGHECSFYDGRLSQSRRVRDKMNELFKVSQ